MELAQLDQCLRERDFTQALVLIFQTLNNIEYGEDLLLDDYAHLAECLITCIKDPECELSDQIFYALLIHHHKIRDLLALCDPTRTLLAFCADWVKKNRRAKNKVMLCQGLKRYYLCFDWSSRPILAWDILAGIQPDWFLAFALSAMAHQTILTAEQVKHLKHFQKRVAEFEMPMLLEHCVPLLVRAWDQLVYQVDKNGIQTQRWLNRLLQKWLRSIIPPNMHQSIHSEKPTILIVLENFNSHHALYRCLAPMVKLLTTQFNCVALCTRDGIDEKARELFTTVLEVSWKVPKDIRAIVSEIRQLSPTVIYYPSLGMHSIAVCLANLRLAPLQIMAPGQAATSSHAEMDHVMIFSEFYHEDAKRSEKPMVLPANQYRFVLPDELRGHAPITPKNREKVQIIIPATHYKLNATFLQRCALIQSESTEPVQFHFTPYSTGLAYYAHRQAIHAYLPDAIVHPKYEYKEYLELLSECDFALMSVPFGGSNSSVDLCGLGIPFVCEVGVEPFARVDACLSTLMQLPEWCRAGSASEYVDAALKLIADPSLRLELSARMQANQPCLLSMAEGDCPVDYANLIANLITDYHADKSRSQAV